MAKKEKEELDTETTIVDMNVDGFRWYNPDKKKNKNGERRNEPIKLTRKEKRAMLKGAFLAILPFVACVALAFGIVFLLAYLWLS